MDQAHKDLLWTIGVLTASAVAVASFIIQLFNGWRERRSSDKFNMREIAFKAAVAEWEFQRARHASETEAEAARNETFNKPIIRPVEMFDYILIKKLKMLSTFRDGDISRKGLEKRFSEMAEFHKFFREYYAAAKAKADESKS